MTPKTSTVSYDTSASAAGLPGLTADARALREIPAASLIERLDVTTLEDGHYRRTLLGGVAMRAEG